MNQKIFREKSLEQLSTPEQLTGYLRVTGPGVWVVLVGVIALLVGMIIWGIFGRISSTVDAPAMVEKGVLSCYVLSEDMSASSGMMDIAIGDVEIQADAGKSGSTVLDASDNPMLYRSGYLAPGRNVTILTAETNLTDGYYDAVVTTQTLKPISLLFSGS